MKPRWRPSLGMRPLSLVLALAIVPAPSQAIAPVLLVLVKEMVQQAATSMVKDMLLASLSGMGCKGIALANAIQAYDLRAAATGSGVASLLGGMPKIPAGMAMPGLPNMPNMGAGAGLGGAALGAGMAPGMSAEMAAKLGQMMPGAGQMPPGLDAEQAAMMNRMLQAMGEPLSPPETLATIDELFELGFLPKAIQGELKECMLLVPATIPALGMGMGMLKPMIPQLRQARDEMRALSTAEQDELADALLQQLKPLPTDERKAVLEFVDSGFFPPRVAQRVKQGLTAG